MRDLAVDPVPRQTEPGVGKHVPHLLVVAQQYFEGGDTRDLAKMPSRSRSIVPIPWPWYLSDTAKAASARLGTSTLGSYCPIADAMIDFGKKRHHPFGSDSADDIVDDIADEACRKTKIPAFGRELIERMNDVAILRASRPR